MDARLLWRAIAVQLAAVAVLFLLLLALPLPNGFFRDYGPVTGPVAWIACALITARVLSLATRRVLVCALGSGAIAAILGLLVGHAAGLLLAVVVFGLLCAALPVTRPGVESSGSPGAWSRG